ncbi:MAG TPA: hypothetical protein VL171_07000 [Verrucomicrobiae bacterium]|nr:hypothetical protein [Verrucomicrobiae bacterium]
MTLDLSRILAGKRAMREKLAHLPLAEKLRMLDELRERTLTIRRAGAQSKSAPAVRERSPKYRSR